MHWAIFSGGWKRCVLHGVREVIGSDALKWPVVGPEESAFASPTPSRGPTLPLS